MRERTTWNRSVIAAGKQADDPRAMNQDHLKQQPAADAYVTGTPSDFAEDVAPSNWKAEYSGGEVKRNEIGMPDLRPETFNHPEKTAAQQQADDEDLEKKASVCIKYASLVLPKTASEGMIEDQALAFMHLPDAVLIDSYNRLASQQQDGGQGQDQGKQAQDQQQQQGQDGKQAGEVPPQFLENIKKKKEEGGDDKEQGKQAQQQQDGGQEQSKQAQQQQDGGQGQGQDQGKQAQQQAQQQAEEEKKQASAKLAALAKAACDAMAQGDMQLAQQQIQQMVQQAQGQQGQQPQQQLSQQQQMDQIQQMVQQAMQQQAPQAPAQQVMASDDDLLNQMLSAEPRAMLASAAAPSMDIELVGMDMDLGGLTHTASEDETLNALFASSPEAQEAAQAHAIQTGMPHQASAGMTRTAATRTVGTRPSGGVASLGGAVPASSGGNDVDKLAGLWQSAPDIRNLF